MTTRLRLLQGATALLYLGPLLAGLSGHGWAMVLAFVAIFTLWSVILRPHLWPRPSQARRPEALVALAALIATQTLLVVVCFGLGRGFGGVTGMRLDLPFWFPAALSFLSVPLSRLAWPRPFEPAHPEPGHPKPGQAEGFDPLAHIPPPEGPEPLMIALSRLPEDVGELELQAHLMASRADPWAVRAALSRAPGPVMARARVIQATDPHWARVFAGSRYAASLFPPAPQDLSLYAARALRVLDRDPRLAADFPTAVALQAAIQREPAAPLALDRLAGVIQEAETLA